MNYEQLLSDNLKNAGGLSTHRGMYGVNPYQGFPAVSKFPTPYQFPASSSGANPYVVDDSALNPLTQGYGLKYASDMGYGHLGVETQSHYGPPMMQHKDGKLKGAALSALTLLAFLFFLNLLQSCLKDQMDSMNPTVMVMSAGQRTYIATRKIEELRKANTQTDEFESEEFSSDDKNVDDYEDEDYPQAMEPIDQTPAVSKTRKRTKTRNKRRKAKKREKQQRWDIIDPKLNNVSVMRSD